MEEETPSLSTIFNQFLSKTGPLISYDSRVAHIVRLPGRDDDLCREILNEIVKRGALGIHAKSLNVWLFTEWDTLYGRSLADTFKSIAAPAEQEETTKDSVYTALNRSFLNQWLKIERERPAKRAPEGKCHPLSPRFRWSIHSLSQVLCRYGV